MSIVNVTGENYQSEVIESTVPVLVDFHATWCGPCKMLSPILDQLAGELTTAKICKVDVDQAPELAQQYKVVSVPTLAVVKDGEVVSIAPGVKNKNQLIEMLGL